MHDVVALVLVLDLVGEAALPPPVGLAVDLAALGGDLVADGLRPSLGDGLVEVTVEDDHEFIGSHASDAPPCGPGPCRGPAGLAEQGSVGPGEHSALRRRLRRQLSMPWDQHDKGVRESSRVDLRHWILTDHASTATRFEQAIGAHVPVERWKERAGGDGASIAWLLFHLSYHQDLALNSVVLGRPPLLADHRDGLGLAGTRPTTGSGRPSSLRSPPRWTSTA